MGALYGPHIRSAAWVWEDAQWQWAMTAPVDLDGRRSLTEASWRLTPTPQTAHVMNVGLHLGVVGLMAWLAWQLGLSPDGVGLVALFAAFHPLTVETVAYAAARSELIAALGVLLAVVCAAGPQWWRPLTLIGLLAGVTLGWMGKESAVVGLVLVPLTMLICAHRQRDVIWVLVAGLGVAALTMWSVLALSLTGLVNLGEAADMHVTWLDWLLLQSAAAYRLIGLTVWPAGLTIDYDYDLTSLIMRWLALFALLGFAATTALLWRRHRLVAYGLTWTLLTVTPRFLVQTPRSYLNEHQFYLPLMGLILAGVAWWDREATA